MRKNNAQKLAFFYPHLSTHQTLPAIRRIITGRLLE